MSPAYKPVVERFWPKVDKSGECWNWTAFVAPDGYGRFSPCPGKSTPAHRVSFELSVGPIPDGMHIDHMCHNRSCVKPAHLRAVTPAQNSQNRKGVTALNTSGFRGVVLHKRTGKWQARAMRNGKYYSAGYYDDINDAAAAAQALRDRLYGKELAA